MAQRYTGQVQNGVIVFDAGAPALPEGTKVRVEELDRPETTADMTLDAELCERADRAMTIAERFAAIIGIAEGLPADFAAEHDHYIHGTPRRTEE